MTWGMVAMGAGAVISAGIGAYSSSQQGSGSSGSSGNSAAMINMLKGKREYKLDEKAMKNVVGKLDQLRATGKEITPEMYDALYRAELQTAADIALKKQEANAGLTMKSAYLSEDARQFDEKLAAGAQEGSGSLAGQGLSLLSSLLNKKKAPGVPGDPGSSGFEMDMAGGTGDYASMDWGSSLNNNICIIISTCTGAESDQVNMARRYRDNFLDKETLRGYYMLSELIVPVIATNDDYKQRVKNYFVDSMMEYFEYLFEVRPVCSDISKQETLEFLGVCHEIGKDEPEFMRSNGEVV